MSVPPLSLKSAKWKYEGTKAYFNPPFVFFEDAVTFQRIYQELPMGAFIGVWNNKLPANINITGKLIESTTYDDGSFHLFLEKTHGDFNLVFNRTPRKEHIPGITFSFICTGDVPYFPMLLETLESYKRWIPENLELSVVLYGEGELPPYVRTVRRPIEEFSMAKARNLCLHNASHDHIFVLDSDVRLSYNQFNQVIGKYQTLPHQGVVNLKSDPTIGNGLYFGNRHVMIKNGYDERFVRFWGEDTEHFMNYSRTGTIPLVLFQEFDRKNHSREKTLANHGHEGNFFLFQDIARKGKR